MIPKRIYYCWLGNEMPYPMKACIESWSRVLPDYEIIKLSEKDIDFDLEYNKIQYSNKKWAYLSDVLRLQALMNKPGIYLDTDIYMLKPFTEEMLSKSIFMGADNSAIVACGVIGVSDSNDPLLKNLHSIYENYGKPGFRTTVNTIYTKDVLRSEYGLTKIPSKVGSKPIELKNITVYPREYFYPLYWNASNPLALTDNTISFHLWTGSANKNNSSRFSYEKHKQEIIDYMSKNYPYEYEHDFKYLIDIMIKGKDYYSNLRKEDVRDD